MLSALNVLLVDDYPADRKLIRHTIGKAFPHCHFDEASTRDEFLEDIDHSHYDLIITDYIMRAFDGIELIDIVQQKGIDTPVIMVTGTGNEETAIEAIHHGAADYVIKQKKHISRLPFTIEQVIERRRAHLQEEKNIADLRDSESRKSAILNTALDCIICIDGNGEITEFNPAAEHLFAYRRSDVLSQNMATLLIPKALHQFCDFGFATFSACDHTLGQGQRFESQMCNKQGEELPVEVTLTTNHVGGSLIVTFSVRDLSDKKLLEEEFFQAQKMDAIGTLVGGIAHDFNNMLAGITGNCHLAAHYSDGNEKTLQKLKNIDAISFQAAAMIRQLLTFARKGVSKKSNINLRNFIQDILQLQRVGMPENIDFRINICAENIHVLADASQLQQLMMNLMINAVDAVRLQKEPQIDISLSTFEPDPSFKRHHSALQDPSYIHLRIDDNGIGIAPALLNKIFDPFFTTKAVGRGTGLGLAMVYGAIKSHNGEINVSSTLGKGTRFDIYLPRLIDTPATEKAKENAHLSLGHGEMILLVDDDLIVLETGKAVLKHLGYRVIVATNGIEAIEIFRQNQTEIDLVILDVVMPKMGGIEAAQHIQSLHQQTNIIFSTGYDSQRLSHQRDLHIDAESIVHKPYRIGTLSRIIEQRLAGRHGFSVSA